MPVLPNSRHEHFAQSVATGLSIVKAYTSAGYSRSSATSNAARIRRNAGISARIADLKTTIAEGVVKFEIRNRSARLQVLQNQCDDMHNLVEARAILYADHPEGATGMVMKDYRGQKARKEIWKFDAGLVAQILHTLKQAAIEEGQWSEKAPVIGRGGHQRNHATAERGSGSVRRGEATAGRGADSVVDDSSTNDEAR